MPVAVLLGTQRSGTNLLGTLLGSHPDVCIVPEVFNNSYQSRPKMPTGLPYFREYLAACARQDPDVILNEHRRSTVDSYFDLVVRTVGDSRKQVIVQVKYNSLHHGDGVWREPCEQPGLLDFFRERAIPVIHLIRNDRLATALSLYRARVTDIYRVEGDEPVPQARFRVDPAELLARLQCMASNQAIVESWLMSGGLRVQRVTYESLFEGEPGSRIRYSTLSGVAEFLGVDIHGFDTVPVTRKLSLSGYRAELQNYDEIEEALRDTEYHASLLAR